MSSTATVGVFYAAQSGDNAALRDFDTALGIKPKLVPALSKGCPAAQAANLAYKAVW